MITYYFRTLKDEDLKALTEVRTGVWVHVESPTAEELEQLKRGFDIDDVMLEDAMDFFEVPRYEKEGSVSYFFTRYPYDEKDEDIDTAPLMIAMGESFVLTIAQRSVPFLKPFMDGKVSIYTTQKTKLFLEILDALTRAYNRELVRMRKAVYRDRTRLRAIRNRDIQRLVGYEHALNDTLAALVPTNNWIKQLTKDNHVQMYNNDLELLEDLIIDNNQLIESAMSILKTIQNIRTATESILTNNLNSTIRTLTVLTILLTVPNIVSSLFGMNVPVPMAEVPHAFTLIVLLILSVVTMMVYFFKKNEWL